MNGKQSTADAVAAELLNDDEKTQLARTLVPAQREPSPGELIDRALDKGATPEAIEKLVALYERLKAGQAKEAYVRALAEFQSRCPVITKTKEIKDKSGKVRYRYAPMDEIVKAVRDILHDCGLSYAIDAAFAVENKLMSATCTITHELGHRETSTFMAPIDPDSYMSAPQKYASALTYAKRYAFCNALGILTGDEDDDANVAGNGEAASKGVSPKAKTPPPPPEEETYDGLTSTKWGERFNQAYVRLIEKLENSDELAVVQMQQLCHDAGYNYTPDTWPLEVFGGMTMALEMYLTTGDRPKPKPVEKPAKPKSDGDSVCVNCGSAVSAKVHTFCVDTHREITCWTCQQAEKKSA